MTAVKAFFIVPIIPSVIFATIASILGLVTGGLEILPAVLYSFPIWLMFALPVAYAATIIAGIPAYLIFYRFGWMSRSRIILAASSIGLIIGILFAIIFTPDELLAFLAIALVFALFGFVSGFVFWRFTSNV